MRLAPLALFLLACPADTDSGKDGDTAGGTDSGGDTGPGPDLVSDCSTAACGGDATGTWNIEEGCPPGTQEPMDDCATGYMEITAFDNGGTLTLDADGSFTANFTGGSATVHVYMPSECLGGATCAQLEDAAQQNIPGVVCVDGTGGCDCTAETAIDPDSDSGTYTTSGTTVTFVSDSDGNTSTADYCADDDEMWLKMREGESDMPLGFVLSRP